MFSLFSLSQLMLWSWNSSLHTKCQCAQQRIRNVTAGTPSVPLPILKDITQSTSPWSSRLWPSQDSFKFLLSFFCLLFIWRFQSYPSIKICLVLPLSSQTLSYPFPNPQGSVWTHNTNYAVEYPRFGEITGVSTSHVQGISLELEKPLSWSWHLPCQATMDLSLIYR